jgi:hypothetical protein
MSPPGHTVTAGTHPLVAVGAIFHAGVLSDRAPGWLYSTVTDLARLRG